jgi:hypothetical protein
MRGFLSCQAALPHKRLPDADGWHVQSDRVSLIVEPGMRLGRTGTLEPVGVPYGSRARLILIYLQSEAIRTQSRDITLGRNLRGWLGVWASALTTIDPPSLIGTDPLTYFLSVGSR